MTRSRGVLTAADRWLEDPLAAAAKGAVFVAADGDEVVGVIGIRSARHFTGELDG